jgi:Mrp family chromosome partitioning ATPase
VPRPRLRHTGGGSSAAGGAAGAAAGAASADGSAAAAAATPRAPAQPTFSGPQRNKLIVIMVGLPGRGKTFLCNKLRCYLSWLGHNTAHFNVGAYRRMQRGSGGEVQDAAFFDAHNAAGVEARNRALDAALADLMAYLESEHGQVGIFDATNSTAERRKKLVRASPADWCGGR